MPQLFLPTWTIIPIRQLPILLVLGSLLWIPASSLFLGFPLATILGIPFIVLVSCFDSISFWN